MLLRSEQGKIGSIEGYNQQSVFFKPAPMQLERKFVTRLRDREITDEFYCNQFRKEIPKELVACVEKFHPHVKDIDVTQTLMVTSSKYNLN